MEVRLFEMGIGIGLSVDFLEIIFVSLFTMCFHGCFLFIRFVLFLILLLKPLFRIVGLHYFPHFQVM